MAAERLLRFEGDFQTGIITVYPVRSNVFPMFLNRAEAELIWQSLERARIDIGLDGGDEPRPPNRGARSDIIGRIMPQISPEKCIVFEFLIGFKPGMELNEREVESLRWQLHCAFVDLDWRKAVEQPGGAKGLEWFT